MDEDLAQVPVAALADPVEPCVATGRILAWHNAEPRSELSSLVEGCPVADRRDDRGRDRRSDPRDMGEPSRGPDGFRFLTVVAAIRFGLEDHSPCTKQSRGTSTEKLRGKYTLRIEGDTSHSTVRS
jgi:hypothetical protein